jgi:RNA polymerase sigma factor (sigma-70 family)
VEKGRTAQRSGRGGGVFPATRRSVVEALGSTHEATRRAAWDALANGYWQPVHAYLRMRWRASPAEADDLTQGFFAFALEKRALQRFDASRARFRTWLRRCLDGFVANEREAARRQKRGGTTLHVSVDAAPSEAEAIPTDLRSENDLDALFHREWVRALLSDAVRDLREASRAAGRQQAFEIFASYDLVDDDVRPSYAEIALDFDTRVTTVTNTLHAMRRRFRDAVWERLRRTCADEAEALAEARALFGKDPQ